MELGIGDAVLTAVLFLRFAAALPIGHHVEHGTSFFLCIHGTKLKSRPVPVKMYLDGRIRIHGITTARSEKKNKRKANRIFRRMVKERLKSPEPELPEIRVVSNV